MQSKAKILLLTLSCSVAIYACSKYKDPDPAQPDPRLNNPYCNDSRAINYNWGFPGKPDNSVCIYPVDPFLGSWVLTDTIYLVNGDISGVQTKNLTFTATEDTILTHLSVSGWCGGTTPFYLTANKYRKAVVDTLLIGSIGQYLCNNTDTLSGMMTAKTDTFRIDLAITNASGTTYHKGTAIKL